MPCSQRPYASEPVHTSSWGGGDDGSSAEEELTFDSAGGSYIGNVAVNEDGKTKIPAAVPTFAKHSFKEWNTRSDGTGDSFLPGNEYNFTSGLTLHAIWNNVYTISFNTSGGNGIDSADVVDGKPYVLPPAVKNGMYFKGWNTREDGSGESYASGTGFVPASDTILYAQWAEWGLLNARVGTELVYSISGDVDPQGHEWIEDKITSIRDAINIALSAHTGWKIDFGVDSTSFVGEYTQKITAFSDNGTDSNDDDSFTYSRDGSAAVTLKFHISADHDNKSYSRLSAELIKAVLTSEKVGCAYAGNNDYIYTWTDCKLVGDANDEKTIGMNGSFTCTVAQITPSAEAVYRLIDNSFLGTIDAVSVTVTVDGAPINFTVSKDTLITVMISSDVTGLYSFEASLKEINGRW